MKNWTLKKAFPYILVITSIIGLVASLALTYDKIHVLKDPSYVPSCNINPVVSCGSVMKTEQANLFGMPNTIFGIIGFTAILTIAVSILAGGKFNKKLWQALQIGSVVSFAFAMYLMFQGIFRIGAVCPWCFTVWLATSAQVLYISVYNWRDKYFKLPKLLHKPMNLKSRYHVEVLISWYLIIIAIILQHFWYYWQTVL